MENIFLPISRKIQYSWLLNFFVKDSLLVNWLFLNCRYHNWSKFSTQVTRWNGTFFVQSFGNYSARNVPRRFVGKIVFFNEMSFANPGIDAFFKEIRSTGSFRPHLSQSWVLWKSEIFQCCKKIISLPFNKKMNGF